MYTSYTTNPFWLAWEKNAFYCNPKKGKQKIILHDFMPRNINLQKPQTLYSSLPNSI